MKFLRVASGLALAVTLTAGAAEAVTLAQAAQPAERPPASYSGDVYVDSRGCAYVRATIGSTVNWVPRLGNDRKSVICGLTPTAQVAGLGSARPPAPPAPPAPAAMAPVPVASAAPALAPAAAVRAPVPTPVAPVKASAPAAAVASNAIVRTMAVTCPSNGTTARVRIGGDTVSVQCAPNQTAAKSYIVRHPSGERTRLVVKPPVVAAPAPVAALPVITVADTGTTAAGTVRAGDVLHGGRVRIGNTPITGARGDFGSGYGTSTYPGPFDPVPSPGAAGAARTAVPNAIGPRPGSGTSEYGFGNGYNLAPVPNAGRVVIPDGYKPAWKDGRLNPNRGPQSAYGDQQMAATLTIDEVPMRTLAPAPARGLVAAPQTGFFVSTKAPTAVPATVARSAPVAASAAVPTKRYVQVGMFNVPANATRAAAKLQSLGLPGRVAQTASGKTVVIAGPYDSVSALNAALSAARRGFPDAFLRN